MADWPAPVLQHAKREKKSEFAGMGCFLQGLGIIAPVILGMMFSVVGVVIGLVLLVVLFFVGSAKSGKWVCGSCKNPIASRDVTVCPACRVTLE